MSIYFSVRIQEKPMKFADLGIQFLAYENEIRAALDKVLASTAFINGPAVSELEDALASYCGAKYAVTCASGTDALLLGLMAQEIQPGDEVIVPAFTYIATASMVAFYKARPVFVDVDPITYTIDTQCIIEAITSKTKGIIPVSLFGQCAEMDEINNIASANGLWVMEDAAQSFGAAYKGQMSCNLSELSATSFFPAKPLGCYGDGGAVFTNDNKLAERIRMLRNHGQLKRYHHKVIGINGRMDTLQAAVLQVKLNYFQEEVVMRNTVAERYTEMLSGIVDVPTVLDGNTSTWAQYTIRTSKRDEIRKSLNKAGIPSAIHYPVPLGKQEAFAHCGSQMETPVADNLVLTVLSLPMHAFISANDQHRVVECLKAALHA